MKSLQFKLRNLGIKLSYQRLKILDYLAENTTHPTVDVIYAALVKEIPTISKTTVYNTLKLLVGKGIILELSISGKESRYDPDIKPHAHFLCKDCDKLIDVNALKLSGTVKEFDGGKIEELHVYFKGRCNSCLKIKAKEVRKKKLK